VAIKDEMEPNTSLAQEAPIPVVPELVSAEALSALWFVRYHITLVPRSALVLPVHSRGSMIRGAFGMALRRLVCHDLDLSCRTCPLEASCAYPQAFEPRPPANADRLSNFQDVPRPFVFDPPAAEEAEFAPRQPVTFGLTAIGRAARLVPYFVSAFRNLADEGLGPRRARFDLLEVAALDAAGTHTAIYQNTTPLVRLTAPTLRADDLVKPGDTTRTSLLLRFTTPLDLKDQGVPVGIPEFAPILRRLRDRANALSTFFGDGPLDLDFKGISAVAEGVKLVRNATSLIEVNRRSSRTGQRHDVGGLIGEAEYEGQGIGRLMALVRVGEVMHVGKHAAFGNGRMEVRG
jgi:CRISPR-associated endoribonuclease Cas6